MKTHTFLLKSAVIFLSLLVLAPVFAVKKGYHLGAPVAFRTSDGVVISGLYSPPSSLNVKTFILLHGLGSNQDEWQGFAGELIAQGYGFLSYDARGHGKSTVMADGKAISFETFGPGAPNSQWSRMVTDLSSAVLYLVNEKKLRTNKIGLIGASLGANVALVYASSNEQIPVVVLLSPGLNYAGVGTLDAIQAFHKRPIALAASPGDTYAYQSTQLLSQQLADNKRAVFIEGAKGHGVNMFDNKFDKVLLRWIANR
jgi:pimeloyl-ACP methyl ester carboxylesterase